MLKVIFFSKPESEIFHRALKRIGVNASEAMMVGDSLVSDIKGAKSGGIRFKCETGLYYQKSLKELLNII